MRKANNKNRDNIEINISGVRERRHTLLFFTLFISLCAVFTLSVTACADVPDVYRGKESTNLPSEDEDTGEESGDTEPGSTEPGGTEPGGTEPGGTEPGGDTSEDEEDYSITISDDIVGEWSSPQSGLSIFGDSVVAPGDKGTYTFYITNNSQSDFIFDIDLSESNEFGVAFFYKLKDETSYIVSEPYYPIEHTSDGAHFASSVTLSGGATKAYTLEWEWDDNYKDGEGDANDTAAGQSGKTDFYSLTIKISGDFDVIETE